MGGENIEIIIKNENKKNVDDIKKELIKRGFEIESNIYPQSETFRVKGIWDVDPIDYSKVNARDTKQPELVLIALSFGIFSRKDRVDFIKRVNKLVVALLEILGVEFLPIVDSVRHTLGFYYKDKDYKKVVEIIRETMKYPKRWPKVTNKDLSDEKIKELIDEITGFREKIDETNCLWFIKCGPVKKYVSDISFSLYAFLDKNFGETQK